MDELLNASSIQLSPGQVCILDKMNQMKMAGNTLMFVRIIKELPRWLHMKRTYEVQFCTAKGESLSDQTFPVDGFRLYPYYEQEYIVRFPSNIPMVNNIELASFKYIYSIAKQYANMPPDAIRALDDLQTKLEFFVDVEREY